MEGVTSFPSKINPFSLGGCLILAFLEGNISLFVKKNQASSLIKGISPSRIFDKSELKDIPSKEFWIIKGLR